MKSLPVLKRLQDFKLDEAKRRLGALNEQLNTTESNLKQMLESHQHQQDVKRLYAKDAPQLDGHIYGNYIRAIEEQRKELLKRIAELNRDIFLEAEEMRKVYLESKKLDILEEEAKARLKAEQQRKENYELDEVGARSVKRS